MQLNLVRNGYNLERRKLYPMNPRNNMASTIDFVWDGSLEDENKFATTRLRNKVKEERQFIKHRYDELVQRQMQEQKRMDKSSFRVLPAQKETLRLSNPTKYNQNPQNILHRRQSFHSGQGHTNLNLNDNHQNQPRNHNNNFITSRQILQPITTKRELKASSNLSRTVFGYEINPQNFKRQSYFTKMLSDRIDPYLEQLNLGNNTHKRHRSVIANQVFSLNY